MVTLSAEHYLLEHLPPVSFSVEVLLVSVESEYPYLHHPVAKVASLVFDRYPVEAASSAYPVA